MPRPRRAILSSCAAALSIGLLCLSAPAFADDGSIDHVESKDGSLQVLYSVPGAGTTTPDLDTVRLTLDGKPLDAKAQLASDAQSTVRRTTVLAIDVSNSMRGAKFAAAKRAAKVFLDSVPDDLYVGIVTFAGSVQVVQQPSLDRDSSLALVKGLKLSLGTSLYDGVIKAASTSGAKGPRSVLVLSDGRDTSTTQLSDVTDVVKAADVKVDVIALAQAARDEKLLAPLARAGDGSVISAADPRELGQIFTSEAQALASQVLVTAALPTGTPEEGTLSVSVDVGSADFTDSAFVTLQSAKAKRPTANPELVLQPAVSGRQIPASVMLGGIAAIGVGLVALVLGIFGGGRGRSESLEDRINAYTTRGARAPRAVQTNQSLSEQAITVAEKALQGSHGFEVKLGAKLEAGGLTLKPAEWLLLHAGIALGVTAVLFLISGGDLLMAVIGLVLGVAAPWIYLGRKQARRLKSFNAQLAGTLQLLAGSLQAGLSVAQGMDTIVREGAEPVAGEFRRALVETRLGVQIEDALDSVGERMMSEDFKWTVMAIRIQREVGGNLAELLLNVAATLREREYLRRQVKSLSAEGRFSAYILLVLPIAALFFEVTTNRSYVEPLISSPLGWAMLTGMTLMMGIGAFMMSRMIKLEV